MVDLLPLPKKYPSAIVWCPIPILTWIFPFIGHLGIAYTEGTVCDFQGPYHVSEQGTMAFGEVTRYIPINVEVNEALKWNDCVKNANVEYNKRMHNLCCDNCHSHVAHSLNEYELYGFSNWNMIILAMWMFFCGRFCSVTGFLSQFLPFALFFILVVVF